MSNGRDSTTQASQTPPSDSLWAIRIGVCQLSEYAKIVNWRNQSNFKLPELQPWAGLSHSGTPAKTTQQSPQEVASIAPPQQQAQLTPEIDSQPNIESKHSTDTAAPASIPSPASRTDSDPTQVTPGEPSNQENAAQAAQAQAAQAQAAQEQAAREQAAREQAAREQAAREQAAREQAAQNRQLGNKQLGSRQLRNRQLENRQLENRQLENRQLENRQLENRQLENMQLRHRLLYNSPNNMASKRLRHP